MAAKDCAITCKHWFEGWNSIAIAPTMMLMVGTLRVLVAISNLLFVLKLIVDTIMASFPSTSSCQSCIVHLKLFLVFGG